MNRRLVRIFHTVEHEHECDEIYPLCMRFGTLFAMPFTVCGQQHTTKKKKIVGPANINNSHSVIKSSSWQNL